MKKHLIIVAYLVASSGHAMERSDHKKPDDVRINVSALSDADRKEKELFERMAAMRLEQAQRNQSTTSQQPTPVEYEQPAEIPKKGTKELNMFATDCASPEYIQKRRTEGYLVHQATDGITCFYRPGTEGLVSWFLSNFRQQRQEMQSDSSNE